MPKGADHGDHPGREDRRRRRARGLARRRLRPARFAKTSERLREGRLPADRLVAGRGRTRPSRRHGSAVERHRRPGAGRSAARPAWRCIRPIAIAASARRSSAALSRGRGSPATALFFWSATRRITAVSAFRAASTGGLWMPGRYDRDRLLALELKPGALDGARGLIGAAGPLAPAPDLAALVAEDQRAESARLQRARAA